ncbi:KAP family P-loop NTPase fold protein [Meridianimarinicoccus sp. RP-17]
MCVEADASFTPNNDFLQRGGFAQRLSNMLQTIDEPLVVAIDGAWGSGKTHFLRIWKNDHQKKYCQDRVVYINAFQHDYLGDPLVSLVRAVNNSCGEQGEKSSRAIESLVTASKKVAFPVIRILSGALSAGVSNFGSSVISEIISGIAAESEEIASRLWDAEESRIAAMEEFRAALRVVASERRLIIIIDELDRCRPDYALAMLEVAKHLFGESRVHFLLGVNVDVLAASVSHRYGRSVNGRLYLQKFISLQLSIPEIRNSKASLVYYEKMVEYVESEGYHSEIIGILKNGFDIACLPFFAERLTLRSVQRIFQRVLTLYAVADSRNHHVIDLTFFLIILRSVSPDDALAIESRRITLPRIAEILRLRDNESDTHRKYTATRMYYILKRIIGEGVDDSELERYQLVSFSSKAAWDNCVEAALDNLGKIGALQKPAIP